MGMEGKARVRERQCPSSTTGEGGQGRYEGYVRRRYHADRYLDADDVRTPWPSKKSGKAAENIRREHGGRTPSSTRSRAEILVGWVRFDFPQLMFMLSSRISMCLVGIGMDA